jgi:hypothetical protein
MDDQSIRYTLGQMIALNHGRTNVPPGMAKLFSTYVNGLPKEYNNKFNTNLPISQSTAVPRTLLAGKTSGTDVYKDTSVLGSIRHIFGSLAKSKTDTTVALLNGITIPVTMVGEVARLFFETCIQCPAVCDEYLNVLFRLTYPNQLEQKITFQFVQTLIENYKNPPVLPDSKVESGVDRMKNYNAAICLLYTKLFVYPFPSGEQFKNPRAFFANKENLEKFLNPLFQKMNAGDVYALQNVAVVYRLLKDKCPGKFQLEAYLTQIKVVYENKNFKLTTRLALKDFI